MRDGYALEPMGRRVPMTDDLHMPLAIRCHPCVPVEQSEIEAWLERELGRIRADVPDATVRLLRLSQEVPSGLCSVGWLIELDIADGLLEAGRLDVMLSEMRLLGLQPTVLEVVRRATART